MKRELSGGSENVVVCFVAIVDIFTTITIYLHRKYANAANR